MSPVFVLIASPCSSISLRQREARWIAKHALKAVYLIHDLIPITHPEYCRPSEPARHAIRMRAALRTADVDGDLVTGQNQNAGPMVAREMLRLLVQDCRR